MIYFAAASMLGWLVATNIPWLLNRQRARHTQTIDWSNNRFLKLALAQQKKAGIQNWLLLLIRILAVLAIALAVADPRWLSTGLAANRQAQPTLHVHIIDISASMNLAASPNDLTSQSMLRETCEKIYVQTANYPSLDVVAIFIADDHLQFVAAIQANKTAELKKTLNQVTTTSKTFKPERLFDRLSLDLQQLQREFVDVEQTAVTIHSDFSLNEWDNFTNANLIEKFQGVGPLNLNLDSVCRDKKPNSYTNVGVGWSSDLDEISTQSPTLKVEVVNSNAVAPAKTTLQWIVDGQVVQSEQIALTPEQRLERQFDVSRSAQRLTQVEVRLALDDWSDDNVCYAVLPSYQREEASVIGESIAATLPMRTALESLNVTLPSIDDGSDLQYDRGTILHLIDPNLPQLKAAFTTDNDTTNAKDIVIWLGPRMTQDDWKAGFDDAAIQEFFPATDIRQQTRQQESMAEVLIQDSSGSTRRSSGSFRFPLAEYWNVSSLQDGWQVELTLDSEDNFLIQKQFDQRKISYIVTPPTLVPDQAQAGQQSWNALAAWPTFIPLLDFINQRSRYMPVLNINAGDSIKIPAFGQNQAAVITPEKTQIALPIDEDAGQEQDFRRTATAGIYKLELHASPIKSQPVFSFAVNRDPRETVLRYTKVSSLIEAKVINDLANADSKKQTNKLAPSEQTAAEQYGFRIFLGLAISLLLIECVLTGLKYHKPRLIAAETI